MDRFKLPSEKGRVQFVLENMVSYPLVLNREGQNTDAESSPNSNPALSQGVILMQSPEEYPENASVIEKYLYFCENHRYQQLWDLFTEDMTGLHWGGSLFDGVDQGREGMLAKIRFSFKYFEPMIAKIHSQVYLSRNRIAAVVTHGAFQFSDNCFYYETIPVEATFRLCPDGKTRMTTWEVNRFGVRPPVLTPSNVYLKSSKLANSAARQSIVLLDSPVGSLYSTSGSQHSVHTQQAPLYISEFSYPLSESSSDSENS